jgi:hypothetical protein
MYGRRSIPLPNAGHWNKVQAVKKVVVTPLQIRKDVEQSMFHWIFP